MTDTAPIELPATRRSFVAAPLSSNAPNIHDKNWIPVLDSTNLRNTQDLDLTLSISDSLYSFPKPISRSSSSIQRPKLTQKHSQSSLAPDSPTTAPGEESPKARSGPKKSPLASASSHQGDGPDSGTSAMPRTGGSGSTIEEQSYSLQEAPVSKNDIHSPSKREPAPLSPSINPPRASIFPPTSKYNRKPVGGGTTATRPSSDKSQVATLSESPKLQPALPPPPDIPHPPQAAAEETPQAKPLPTRKPSSKSGASERRARNLTSPKSALSLFTQFPAQSQPQAQTSSINSPSSSDDTDMRARPPSTRHKSRKSNDSRTGTIRSPIYDSTTPTPAPTTPLPQLPPKSTSRPPSVKRTQTDGSGGRTISPGQSHIHSQSRPSSSHASVIPQIQASAQAPPPALPATPLAPTSLPDPDTLPRPSTNEHVELAEFMSRRSTVIFRRFDDVHVKLLFCLQDEISQLEEELGQLEASSATDKTGPKMIRVMRDLRKVVAEYDHLFANWAQMQANKVPGQTLTELREWLEKPSPSGEVSIGAKEDYKWVEEKKGDLSICKFDENGTLDKRRASSASRVSTQLGLKARRVAVRQEAAAAAPSGARGGWWSDCVGKRKK